MDDDKADHYVATLRELSRTMTEAAPSGARQVFDLLDRDTGEPADMMAPPFSAFARDSQQWALAISVGNPVIMRMAREIEKTVDGGR